MKTVSRRSIALLFNLGIPGLGHIFVREYLFGIFIFLIMLIAAILFFVSFFLSISIWPKLLLMALPALFYLFTFVDLYRVSATKAAQIKRGTRAIWVFAVIAIGYQLFAPIAPVNFAIRNSPELFVLEDNSLRPIYSSGDLLKASRLDYSVDIFFLRRPLLHSLPQRYDIVRFQQEGGEVRNGIVLGLPGETVQMVEGVLVVDDLPDFREPPGGLILQGDCPLTYVDSYSILVATLHMGSVDKAYMVALPDVVGKVEKLL